MYFHRLNFPAVYEVVKIGSDLSKSVIILQKPIGNRKHVLKNLFACGQFREWLPLLLTGYLK